MLRSCERVSVQTRVGRTTRFSRVECVSHVLEEKTQESGGWDMIRAPAVSAIYNAEKKHAATQIHKRPDAAGSVCVCLCVCVCVFV